MNSSGAFLSEVAHSVRKVRPKRRATRVDGKIPASTIDTSAAVISGQALTNLRLLGFFVTVGSLHAMNSSAAGTFSELILPTSAHLTVDHYLSNHSHLLVRHLRQKFVEAVHCQYIHQVKGRPGLHPPSCTLLCFRPDVCNLRLALRLPLK